MQRAGFRVLAAIDSNAEAVSTLRTNLVQQRHPGLLPVEHALECDLTTFPPEQVATLTGTDQVDVIVGGPPCQGFSTVRQRDGANSGPRLKADPRRHLYREFLRYVEFFQPKVFVMENVLGLRTAAGGEYFTRVQKESRALGYRVHGQIEDAWELGVPQKRRRQLIIGVRDDLPGYFLPQTKPSPRAEPRLWLGVALGDLPILRAGGGEDERDYDLPRRVRYLQDYGDSGRNYLFDVLEIARAPKLTNHTARFHSERDLRDFMRLNEGENSAVAMRVRGVQFEFPYDKSTFQDRYTRQSRWHPCSTIMAHLSRDGLMFIHPTQNRSLTPREAARIQSFPDWFRFPAARTTSFRLIGNAVPPLVAEALGLAVKEFLGSTAAPAVPPGALAGRNRDRADVAPGVSGGAPDTTPEGGRAPQTRPAAARELERLAQLDRRSLRALPKDKFLAGWHALLFLFPGLHPDNALDHGDDIEEVPTEQLGLPGFELLLARRHTRSGWPVALELIGREAWRRYKLGELAGDEFYCVAAQRAGLDPPTACEGAFHQEITEQVA
jgi:DNA (cytosine-5)-methyltransferase 1